MHCVQCMKFSPQFAESYSAYFLKIILKLTLSAQPILPEIVYLLFLALIFNFNLHFIIRFFLWLFIYFANIHTHTCTALIEMHPGANRHSAIGDRNCRHPFARGLVKSSCYANNSCSSNSSVYMVFRK